MGNEFNQRTKYIAILLKTASLDNAIQESLLAQPSWYMRKYHEAIWEF